MRFSLWPNPFQTWDDIADAARYADDKGWDGVWIADHFMGHPPLREETGDQHEAWSILVGMAGVTERVRLGTLVCGNTYRHPAVLLKQAVSADHVSGGRVVLGIGAGWQENEHRAYGIPFYTAPERLARLDEACEVIRGLLRTSPADARFSFPGDYYQIEEAPLAPAPIGPFPLLVGGGGEQVTLRIAATWADEWNVWGDPATLAHKGQVLERHCEEVERDPTEIRRSTQALLFLSDDEEFLDGVRERDLGMPALIGTADQVTERLAEYVSAGVDEFIVPDWTLGPPERRRDILDHFTEDVMPEFPEETAD